MEENRIKKILDRLEESPEMPLLMVNDYQALEAIGQVALRFPEAKLLMMRGMRYITVSDEAVGYILEQLERERKQYVSALASYDREIAEIRELKKSGKRYYSAPDSLARL